MKLLVTNDDGIDSPGLHALVRGVVEAGFDVTVAAPTADMSGAGASIGRLHVDRHIDAEQVKLPTIEHVPAYAVAGPPGLCVVAARLGGFGDPPDVVLSGINPGCNTGRAVLHSGTVGAALTAANFGLKGLAVSIDVNPDGDGVDGRHWDSAAAVVPPALQWLAEAPAKTVLNVNVPDLPLAEIRGARWGQLASFGTVRTAVVESAQTHGRLQMEFRPTTEKLPPDSDTALVQAGFVAVTSITGIQAADPVDVESIVGPALGAERRS